VLLAREELLVVLFARDEEEEEAATRVDIVIICTSLRLLLCRVSVHFFLST